MYRGTKVSSTQKQPRSNTSHLGNIWKRNQKVIDQIIERIDHKSKDVKRRVEIRKGDVIRRRYITEDTL